MKPKNTILLLCLIILISSCDETLPPRIVPQNTLEITDVVIKQGTENQGIVVAILIIVENVYEDIFHDTLRITGKVNILWKRKPEIEVNVPVNNSHISSTSAMRGRVLTLEPGEHFFLLIKWFLQTDDGRNVLNMLDFSGNRVEGGTILAKPEVFVAETKLTLFNQLGFIYSEPTEFTLVGWKHEPPEIP